jgi:hypothetical protein
VPFLIIFFVVNIRIGAGGAGSGFATLWSKYEGKKNSAPEPHGYRYIKLLPCVSCMQGGIKYLYIREKVTGTQLSISTRKGYWYTSLHLYQKRLLVHISTSLP